MSRFPACRVTHVCVGWPVSPKNVDAPGGVLDHGHRVGFGAGEQVHGEEVARDDRLGLGA